MRRWRSWLHAGACCPWGSCLSSKRPWESCWLTGSQPSGPRGSTLDLIRELALQHNLRRQIGLLQIDAPVLELFERNGGAGHGATHECARSHDPKVSIEIF